MRLHRSLLVFCVFLFMAVTGIVWAASEIALKQTGLGHRNLGGVGPAAFVAPGGTSLAYIATATTTQVKTGAGFLHCITVNTTAAGAISLIDNTAGSVVNIGSMKASIAEGSYCPDVPFATGLRIITAAASDLTVSYY